MHTEVYGHVHKQEEASDTWVVNHGLFCTPVVQVYVNYEGKLQRIVPKSVTIESNKQILIQFSSAHTGHVVLQ